MYSKKFGENVRRIRENRGLTQYEVAEDIGISQTTISAIERGWFPKKSNLIALSNVLEKPLRSILYGTGLTMTSIYGKNSELTIVDEPKRKTSGFTKQKAIMLNIIIDILPHLKLQQLNRIHDLISIMLDPDNPPKESARHVRRAFTPPRQLISEVNMHG